MGDSPKIWTETDRYFPNDPRAQSPALFETQEEDLNRNGLLDPGEDSDHDGVLDHPNVWPEGGDPREDLMTWYERETNTLILRPVVLFGKSHGIAVVLTERLVGMDGDPVRSPWEYVHHLRQTDALVPLFKPFPPTVLM